MRFALISFRALVTSFALAGTLILISAPFSKAATTVKAKTCCCSGSKASTEPCKCKDCPCKCGCDDEG